MCIPLLPHTPFLIPFIKLCHRVLPQAIDFLIIQKFKAHCFPVAAYLQKGIFLRRQQFSGTAITNFYAKGREINLRSHLRCVNFNTFFRIL